MKAAELRIGNWVNLYGDDCRIQTVGMWVHTDTTVDEAPVDAVKPIPLTEEWLKRFGFTHHVISWSKDISYFPKSEFKTLCVTIGQGVLLRRGALSQPRDKDEIVTLINSDIHGQLMVHQLQNLYYALTSEELTLKEK